MNKHNYRSLLVLVTLSLVNTVSYADHLKPDVSEGLSTRKVADSRFRAVKKTASNPGCHLEITAAVVSALLKETEVKAQEECKSSTILTDMKTDIRRVGGCTPVTVEAKYTCK